MVRTKFTTISTAQKLMTIAVPDMPRSSLLGSYADHVPQRRTERQNGILYRLLRGFSPEDQCSRELTVTSDSLVSFTEKWGSLSRGRRGGLVEKPPRQSP